MKRLIAVLLCASMCVAVLVGCAAETADKRGENGKINIVCTVFPVYDWVRRICSVKTGEVDVTLIANAGDLHSFQPSAADIARIIESDMFVYIGGESEEWARKIVKENSTIRAVCLLDELRDSVAAVQIPEYMNHSENSHADGEDDEHGALDEHIWLSPKMAIKAVERISLRLGENGINTASEDYISALKALDNEYMSAVGSSADKTIIVADRFPLLYLTRDYKMDYFAAFPSCSADADASFEMVLFLAEQTEKLNKDTVLVLENSTSNIADAVIGSTKSKNQTTAVINSLQSVSEKDISGGLSYEAVMRDNLKALTAALD